MGAIVLRITVRGRSAGGEQSEEDRLVAGPFTIRSTHAIEPGFTVSWPWVIASAALGLLGPVLAALPAIRRGVRLPVREALAGSAASAAPVGRLERALGRVRFLPRTAQIGLRVV